MYYLELSWFSGVDIIFELVFAIITFLVTIYAFKAFSFTKNKDIKSLGMGFLLLTGAYVALSITNLATIASLSGKRMVPFSTINNISNLNNISLYVYIFLYISGLIFFSCTLIKDKSKKSFLLIYLPVIIALIVSQNKLFLFHLLSLVFLGMVTFHYYKTYDNKKHPKILLIFLAFLFLFIGRVHYLFTLNHELFYILGHFFELIAYLCILAGLFMVVRK